MHEASQYHMGITISRAYLQIIAFKLINITIYFVIVLLYIIQLIIKDRYVFGRLCIDISDLLMIITCKRRLKCILDAM